MSAPSAKQRGHVQAAFVEGVTALLRRALTERFGFRLTVDGKGGDGLAELLDDDGVVMMSHRLAGVQLALPLGAPASSAVQTIPAPAVEASQPPPTPPAPPKACAHAWERIPSGATEDYAYSCWECHTVVGRLDDAFAAIDERYRRNVLFEATPVIPPIAPAGRILRAGDAVHAPDGSTWVVRAIEGDAVYLSLDGATDGLPDEATVARDAITLDAADLWRVAAVPVIPEALAPGVSQVSDGHLAGVSETPDGDPQKSPWTLFSVEVHEREASPVLWAMQKGLRWALGGVVFWSIEGGASKRAHQRMVTIVPRERAEELLGLCDDARLTPDMRDVGYGGGLLGLRSVVRDDTGGAAWSVTAIDRAMQRVELARDEGREKRSVSLVWLDKSYDGTGDFVLMSKDPTPKDPTPKGDAKRPKKAAKGVTAPKATPSKIPLGSVELRVSAKDLSKHRKGLLSLAKQPLGGLWKVTGDTASAVVSVGSLSARRVLSYCNHNNIKLQVEGAPADVAAAMERKDSSESETPAEAFLARPPRATRATLRVDQLVRVASGSAGINGVPVSLAGESVTVVKIGPKLVRVFSRKLGRSYSVLPGDLELLGGGAS